MSNEVSPRLDSIQGDPARPLSFSEGAQYLNCSKSYLYKLTHRRALPFFKPLGKKIFFKRSDLERFLLRNPVKTSAEIEQSAVDHVSLNQRGAL